MQKSKLISVLIIIGIFIGFTGFEIYRKTDKAVLKIISPTVIEVDLNNNKIFDLGETICIPDLYVFTSDLTKNQSKLADKLNISAEDALKLGYLSDRFAENILSDKRIKLKYTGEKNQDCKYADILINNTSYRNKLLESELALENDIPNEAFKKQLEKAKKLKLTILNHKSNKYHTLDCKYGLTAHDTVIIPENQIAKDAKPCKFCHITKEKNLKSEKLIKTYPLAISNGSIKMYLTDLTTKLKPDNKCSSLACKEILNQINLSKTSIDIAAYGWDNIPEINNALLSAKSRGVKIRVVYNSSTNQYYPELKNLIKLADAASTDTPKILMHNKFIIFDNSKLVTGSMNFAKTGFSGFNTNCVFFINSTEISKIYKEEFNQMINGKFHQAKSIVGHRTAVLGSTKVTPLFSPKDKAITNNIIPLINIAQNYIYIPAFIVTHDDFANSLIKAHNRGVNVKLILDATSPAASRSKVKLLRAVGIPVKVENYAGKVHSKSIIIDDKYIIAGSMNFSNSGENKNDENCLIIEDERLARHYRGFFEYLWTKIPDRYLKINPRAEGKTSIGSCTDGIDNNYDGKIDAEDFGCR